MGSHTHFNGQKLYKVLRNDMSVIHAWSSDFVYDAPTQDDQGNWTPGDWTPKIPKSDISICQSGYHLTTDPAAWMIWSSTGYRVFEAEAKNILGTEGDKIVTTRARLLAEVDALDINDVFTKLHVLMSDMTLVADDDDEWSRDGFAIYEDDDIMVARGLAAAAAKRAAGPGTKFSDRHNSREAVRAAIAASPFGHHADHAIRHQVMPTVADMAQARLNRQQLVHVRDVVSDLVASATQTAGTHVTPQSVLDSAGNAVAFDRRIDGIVNAAVDYIYADLGLRLGVISKKQAKALRAGIKAAKHGVFLYKTVGATTFCYRQG